MNNSNESTDFIAILEKLKNDDVSTQSTAMAALRSQRDLLSMIETPGLLDRVVALFQSSPSTTLQFDAACLLTDITAEDRPAPQSVVDAGALGPLVRLLHSPDDTALRNQAIWVLCNIARDSPQLRDAVLQQGVLDPLFAIIAAAPLSPAAPVKSSVIYLLCKCCHDAMSLADVARVLPALLANIARLDTAGDVCGALAVLSDADTENQRIQVMLDAGVAPLLVNVLRTHRQLDILAPALRCTGSILSGDERQTQAMIDVGVVDALKRLLQTHSSLNVRKSVCWAVSNITGGTEQQIQTVMDAKIVPILMEMLDSEGILPDIRREINWVLSNALRGGSSAQIGALIDCLVLQRLLTLLVSSINRVVEEHIVLGVVQCVTVADRAALQRLRLDYRSDIVADFLQSIDQCRNLGTEAGDKAADSLAKALFVIERARMAEICMAMQALDLPALVTVTILEFTVAELVKFHKLWEVAVKVKHFAPKVSE
jgi:importin subunit alpha-1